MHIKYHHNSKQCTIYWYVDNNKVLHVNEDMNTRIIDKIDEHFGELTVSREIMQVPGNVHIGFRKKESIAVCERLHRGFHRINWQRDRYNSTIAIKTYSEKHK